MNGRPATAPAILCDRRPLPRQLATKKATAGGPRRPWFRRYSKARPARRIGGLHRTSHRAFSLKIFYLGFPAEILREKSGWRGGGFKIPCKFLRIFRSAPRGLSNRRAMIPAVRRRALTSITSTALQWHFNNNRCHWCSFRSSGAVRMPTVRDPGASSLRRECIVCGCAVCIICTCASLPSLKMPPISRVVPHPSVEIAPNTPQAPSFVCPAYHWQCRT